MRRYRTASGPPLPRSRQIRHPKKRVSFAQDLPLTDTKREQTYWRCNSLPLLDGGQGKTSLVCAQPVVSLSTPPMSVTRHALPNPSTASPSDIIYQLPQSNLDEPNTSYSRQPSTTQSPTPNTSYIPQPNTSRAQVSQPNTSQIPSQLQPSMSLPHLPAVPNACSTKPHPSPPILPPQRNMTWRRKHGSPQSTQPNVSEPLLQMSWRRTATHHPPPSAYDTSQSGLSNTEWREWSIRNEHDTTPPAKCIETPYPLVPTTFPGLAPPTLSTGLLATGFTTPRLRIENKRRRLNQQAMQSQKTF